MAIERFNLDGKIGVVTGGSGAIGRAAAGVLLELGATVLLAGRTEENLRSAVAELSPLGDVTAVLGDARSPGHIADLVSTASSMGGVDVLINAIGTQRRMPLIEASSADLSYLWEVNMHSIFAVTQGLVPQMVEKNYGKIVHICSIGSFVALQDKTMYAITKGALAQYMKSSAVEFAPFGIRVNGLAPGYVDTPMTHEYIHSERESEFLAQIPLNRFATVADLEGAFAYLTTSASDHMTGQLLVIDGGETLS